MSKDDQWTLNARGLVGLQETRFDEAWTDYEAAVRVEPTNAVNVYGRGIAELRLGRTPLGQADIAAALKLDPKIADTFAGYGIKP